LQLRKVVGAQTIQPEPRRHAGDRRLKKIVGFDFDPGLRQRFDDLHQLARRQADRTCLAHVGLAFGRDRQVEVGRAHRDPAGAGFNQKMREDRNYLFRGRHALQVVEFAQEQIAINVDVHRSSTEIYPRSNTKNTRRVNGVSSCPFV
jgi:hypothetical protein